jgi:FemAB-related protein (PEP-CTERM system-associated)
MNEELSSGKLEHRNGTKNNAQIFVREMTPEDTENWDNFINSSSEGLPTQFSAWQEIIQSSYGHRCYFLMALGNQRIKGVLPIFEVKSRITGHSLQSMPGGICAETPEAAYALIETANAIAIQNQADYLLLRDSRQAWPDAKLSVIQAHRGVKTILAADSDAVFKSMPRRVRGQIARGRKTPNVNILMDDVPTQEFYEVFFQFNQSKGTPLFSYTFLTNLLEKFSNNHKLIVAYLDNKPVAYLLGLINNKSLLLRWGGGLRKYRDLHLHPLIIWSMIRYGCQRGCKFVDFDRSPYPSSYFNFKKPWGTIRYPIYQHYQVYRGKLPGTIQLLNAQGKSHQASLFQMLWPKMPDILARYLGPKIRWHIPFG